MPLLGSEVLNYISLRLRLGRTVVVCGGSSLYCHSWSPLLNATAWIRGTHGSVSLRLAARWWCVARLSYAATPEVLFCMSPFGPEVLEPVSLRMVSKVVVCGGSVLYCYPWSPILIASAWTRGTQFFIIEIGHQGGGVWRVQPLLLLLESSLERHCLDPRYSILYHWDWAARWWNVVGLSLLLLLESSSERHCLDQRYSWFCFTKIGSKVVVCRGSVLYCYPWSPLVNASAWTRGTGTCIIKNGQQGGGVWRVYLYCNPWSPLLNASAWALGTRTCIIKNGQKGGGVWKSNLCCYSWSPPLNDSTFIQGTRTFTSAMLYWSLNPSLPNKNTLLLFALSNCLHVCRVVKIGT
jgi:hypothetical protein